MAQVTKADKKELTIFRLTRLMMTMLGVPRERFNMDAWAGFLDENGEYSTEKAPECKPNLTCGAAACALGWEASQPHAIKVGLHLEIRNPKWDMIGTPVFGDTLGFAAGAKYFGITSREANFLFGPESYTKFDQYGESGKDIAPHDVIGHIAQLIRQYEGLADDTINVDSDDDDDSF